MTQSTPSENNKNYDIVLYGATSYVGQLTASYFNELLKNNKINLTFAIAGRSEDKLKSITNKLGLQNMPIIVANSNNEDSIIAMVEQTKVVITTVGPYDLYGELLVKSCAYAGVHYCDLAGESHWIRRMVDTYAEKALASGSCIVHCCGFDSIPSDLGVHFLQKAAQEKYQQPCTDIELRIPKLVGTMSGGTTASIMNQVKRAQKDPALKKALKSPYQICPSNPEQQKTRQTMVTKPVFNQYHQQWSAPFIMEAINTKIVHRSNALKNFAYTTSFKYSEAMLTGKGMVGRLKANALSLALASIFVGASFEKSRELMQNYLLPKPGQGPSEKQLANGSFYFYFLGKTKDGNEIAATCAGNKDPGYALTAKMLGQSAICLLEDVAPLINNDTLQGGFWTPASLMGDMLIPRLEADAEMTFKVV